MTKFRKKPVVIEATPWFKNGDHPEDHCFRPFEDTGAIPERAREGAVVRYYRNPDHDGQSACKYCGKIYHDHGFIDTLEGGHIVCPGDFVITGVHGEHYPCKPDIFAKTYEEVNENEPKLFSIPDELFSSVLSSLKTTAASYEMALQMSDEEMFVMMDKIFDEKMQKMFESKSAQEAIQDSEVKALIHGHREAMTKLKEDCEQAILFLEKNAA